MDIEEYLILLLYYGLPCILVLHVSRNVVSRGAALILRSGVLCTVLCLMAGMGAAIDCGFDQFSFHDCQTLPDRFAPLYTFLWFWGLFIFPVFVAPVLIAICVALERRARKRRPGEAVRDGR